MGLIDLIVSVRCLYARQSTVVGKFRISRSDRHTMIHPYDSPTPSPGKRRSEGHRGDQSAIQHQKGLVGTLHDRLQEKNFPLCNPSVEGTSAFSFRGKTNAKAWKTHKRKIGKRKTCSSFVPQMVYRKIAHSRTIHPYHRCRVPIPLNLSIDSPSSISTEDCR